MWLFTSIVAKHTIPLVQQRSWQILALGPLFSRKCTRWFKYDRDKLWLGYTQTVPVIFEPPCIMSCFPSNLIDFHCFVTRFALQDVNIRVSLKKITLNTVKVNTKHVTVKKTIRTLLALHWGSYMLRTILVCSQLTGIKPKMRRVYIKKWCNLPRGIKEKMQIINKHKTRTSCTRSFLCLLDAVQCRLWMLHETHTQTT
jgi:hypothetical protein